MSDSLLSPFWAFEGPLRGEVADSFRAGHVNGQVPRTRFLGRMSAWDLAPKRIILSRVDLRSSLNWFHLWLLSGPLRVCGSLPGRGCRLISCWARKWSVSSNQISTEKNLARLSLCKFSLEYSVMHESTIRASTNMT